MKFKIIPAIIAKNQNELDLRLNKVRCMDFVHLDIMDNKFVNNRSLMFDFKLNVKNEAHLMVNNPIDWIKKFSGKVNEIIVHIESCTDIQGLIESLKHKKVSLALNPKTPVEKIIPLLDTVNKILVMTVQPGSYGAGFLQYSLKKVKLLRELSPKLDIAVDGSINLHTIKLVKDAGANQFVIGSYLQNSTNIKTDLKKIWSKILS